MEDRIVIDQLQAKEWGLNLPQAVLFAFLYKVPKWANCHIIGGIAYYWIAYGKIIQELPLLSSKKDTVYRHIKVLAAKGLLEVAPHKSLTLVRLTEKGKTWDPESKKKADLGKKSEGSNTKPISTGNISEDSEKNPALYGKKSGRDLEINPTNPNTSYPFTKPKNQKRFHTRKAEQHPQRGESANETCQIRNI